MTRSLLIGISSYARDDEDPPAFNLPCDYVDAVRAAGGIPVVLPPGQREPERLLESLAGVVFAGGGDLSPSCYGGPEHQTLYSMSEERDLFELDLARAALERGMATLFICRGMQLLNVVRGGTLHAHLPDVFGERVCHRLPPRQPTMHSVRIENSSRLAKLMATDETAVSSWHHQAVDRLGSGLRPVARSEDGVIEALELSDQPQCFAVQWHPEIQRDDARQQKLFAAFVEAVKTTR